MKKLDKVKTISEYLGPNESDKQIIVDDPDMAEKLNFITDGIGCLLSRASIIKAFMEKFGTCRVTAYNYYNLAKDEIMAELKKSRDEHISESLASMRVVAKRALAKGDHAAAVSALKYRDTVVALTQSFNEVGNQATNVQGSVRAIDDESARTLASFIARAEEPLGENQSSPVGQEQSSKD